MAMMEKRDLGGSPIIIGGGLAGLMTALYLAPEPVVLLSKAPLGIETSSAWAQGGIAASIGPGDDASLQIADTLNAGDGICDEASVKRIVSAAGDAIAELIRLGVPFDRDQNGDLQFGLEAAHSRRRIVHAGGDGSGREIMQALIKAVQETPSITVIKGIAARRLIVENNKITGVLGNTNCGPVLFATDRVIIATGGIGSLYLASTNPAGSFGQGLALAARAGAMMADLEFVQFHPTALNIGSSPLPLVSEAVRGEGAILIDEKGERFMNAVPGAELAARDVVARAIWHHMRAGHDVFLDARKALGQTFPQHFPGITEKCRAAGIDPVTQPIPIRPAAHYHMGGILVDEHGKSSIEGLWACGEAASTGLHGANRLASNSLLEAVVCARFVADSVGASRARPVNPRFDEDLPRSSDPSPVRKILSEAAGVLRDRDGLRDGISALYPMMQANGPDSDAALVGLMIAVAALKRQESRGAHTRTDFPDHETAFTHRSLLKLDEALETARGLVPEAVG
jgi:L-aspartate oxidase